MENQTTPAWYENKTIVVLLCIFFFPVGLYALWKNSSISQGWKIGGTLIIGIFLIGAISSDEDATSANNENEMTISANDSNTNDTITSNSLGTETLDSTNNTEQKPKRSLKDQLETELKSFRTKPFDGSGYRESIESLQLEIALFGVWSNYIREAETSEDAKVKQLGKQLAYQVKLVQIKEFPKMRKAYHQILHQKLWSEDIEVTISGYNFTVIEFTGGTFASNKNKLQMQTVINDILKMLRFKRVNYKFTKYDSEYSYYTIESPNDNVIKTLDEF